MQRQVSIFGLVFCFCLTLEAAGTQRYTLEALVESALLSSDQIRSQKARIEEKRESISQAAIWQNPVLEVEAGAKLAAPHIGPRLQVGLSQLLYFPGKQELRKEILDFDKVLEEIRLSEAELAITIDVIRLAYEYAINERKAKFAKKRRKRFELIKSYLAGHTFASPQQKTASILVLQRLKAIGADEQQLQGSLKATLQQLNFYLAQDLEKIPEISVPWLKGRRSIDESNWIEHALRNNIELAKQRLLVIQATKEKDLASKEALPDLTISVFYSQETAGQTERAFGVGVGIPLPILNQNQAGTRSKQHKIRAEEYQLSLKEQRIKSLVKKLMAEYTVGQKIVAEYSEEFLASLESQLKSMEREFRKNRVDFLLFQELDIQAADTANRMFNAQLLLLDTISSLHLLARDKNLISELSQF